MIYEWPWKPGSQRSRRTLGAGRTTAAGGSRPRGRRPRVSPRRVFAGIVYRPTTGCHGKDAARVCLRRDVPPMLRALSGGARVRAHVEGDAQVLRLQETHRLALAGCGRVQGARASRSHDRPRVAVWVRFERGMCLLSFTQKPNDHQAEVSASTAAKARAGTSGSPLSECFRSDQRAERALRRAPLSRRRAAQCRAQLLVQLDRAWQRCFKRLARAPRWKRKGKDPSVLPSRIPRYGA
jgi:hypothetical protein